MRSLYSVNIKAVLTNDSIDFTRRILGKVTRELLIKDATSVIRLGG
jgi:hypothetical protein